MMAGIREGLPENKTSPQADIHIENERRQPKRLLGRRGSVHVKRRKLGRQSLLGSLLLLEGGATSCGAAGGKMIFLGYF